MTMLTVTTQLDEFTSFHTLLYPIYFSMDLLSLHYVK